MPPLANSEIFSLLWSLLEKVILEFDRHWTWILWAVAVDVSWNDTLSRVLIQNCHRFGNFSKYFQDHSLVILYSGRSANIFLCFPDYQTTILHKYEEQHSKPSLCLITSLVLVKVKPVLLTFSGDLVIGKGKTIPLFVAESIMCVRQIPWVHESFHHD